MRRERTMLVGLGSNRPGAAGTPLQMLEAACDLLERESARIAARSRFYRTPAFPAGSGPAFVNAALRVRTSLDPEDALALLHRVEAALGRTRDRRWGPRICDLDLLAVGGEVLPDPPTVRHWMALPAETQLMAAPDQLIVPHPRLHERAFVLVPLADVAGDWRHPILRRTVRQMLVGLPAAERQSIEAM